MILFIALCIFALKSQAQIKVYDQFEDFQKDMIVESITTKERVSKPVKITAFCPSIFNESVAECSLGLSLKARE